MRIGLYKDEYGVISKYREFPCVEIDLDTMTSGTDYSIDVEYPEQTIQGVTFRVRNLYVRNAGITKISGISQDPADLIMQQPFWSWNDATSQRMWMGGHFTSQSFDTEPDDWADALYYKYYNYTADASWIQHRSPVSTTFDPGTTYYVCDSEEYEPQKIYYGKSKYAPSFVIGQMLGTSNTIFPSGANGGMVCGYCCGVGLGSASNVGRTRLFAIKGTDEEYTGYTGMHPYTAGDAIFENRLNEWTLIGTPAQDLDLPFVWMMAHITWSGNEYIGWGPIRFDSDHPETPYLANFAFVPIIFFQDAIVPDKPPYSNGGMTGNSGGSGGTGPGLPDGDSIETTRVAGGLMPLGYGLHAYQVMPSDIGLINDFLWGRSGNAFDPGGMWARFQNYKFNPVAGICSLHHIPFELLCAVGSAVSVSMAGITFDGVSTGGVSITGLPIDSSEHVGHCRFPSSGYFEIKQPYIGFEDFARTKVRLYLPFCGSVDLDPALCIGGGVAVDYQCDNINGNICVQVKTQSAPNANDGRREFVAAVASGNAAYHIPVTGSDNGTGEIIGSLKQAALGALSGNLGAVAGAAVDLGFGLEKHTTSVSGSLAGNVGYLGSLDVILEVTYGDYFSTDGEYEKTIGRPSYVQGIVNDFTGFCQFKVHTDGISGATEAERQEIAQLMEQGVIIE